MIVGASACEVGVVYVGIKSHLRTGYEPIFILVTGLPTRPELADSVTKGCYRTCV